jgi:hypothetical protein
MPRSAVWAFLFMIVLIFALLPSDTCSISRTLSRLEPHACPARADLHPGFIARDVALYDDTLRLQPRVHRDDTEAK